MRVHHRRKRAHRRELPDARRAQAFGRTSHVTIAAAATTTTTTCSGSSGGKVRRRRIHRVCKMLLRILLKHHRPERLLLGKIDKVRNVNVHGTILKRFTRGHMHAKRVY